MSQWRAKALELFPDLRPEIQAAESVGMLWIELASRFKRYYDSLDDEEQNESPELIRAISLYAIWCTRSKSYATQEPAWIEFYEYLPQAALRYKPSIYKKIVEDLVANVGLAEIEKNTCPGHMGQDRYEKFIDDARKADRERKWRSQKR